jgi:hypothetical protein
MTLLDRVSAHLDTHGIAHAVIGAAALAAAGVARSTFDVDLLTGDPAVLAADVWEDLRAEGVTIDIRRGDDDDPLGGVVRIEAAMPERPVDVVLGRHAWQARAVARAARSAGAPPIVLPRDLVLLKLYAGGTQDLWDVRELLRVAEDDTLIDDVESDLVTLPRAMRERWESLEA